jgi:hypothetical protein
MTAAPNTPNSRVRPDRPAEFGLFALNVAGSRVVGNGNSCDESGLSGAPRILLPEGGQGAANDDHLQAAMERARVRRPRRASIVAVNRRPNYRKMGYDD